MTKATILITAATGSNNDVEKITGIPPMSVEQFTAAHCEAFL